MSVADANDCAGTGCKTPWLRSWVRLVNIDWVCGARYEIPNEASDILAFRVLPAGGVFSDGERKSIASFLLVLLCATRVGVRHRQPTSLI